MGSPDAFTGPLRHQPCLAASNPRTRARRCFRRLLGAAPARQSDAALNEQAYRGIASTPAHDIMLLGVPARLLEKPIDDFVETGQHPRSMPGLTTCLPREGWQGREGRWGDVAWTAMTASRACHCRQKLGSPDPPCRRSGLGAVASRGWIKSGSTSLVVAPYLPALSATDMGSSPVMRCPHI